MAKTEKGKINIKPAKKEFSVTVSFNDGKSMPIEKSFKIPENANGKEAEVERERGVISKVVIDGKTYEKETPHIQPNTRKNEPYVNNVSIPEAIAPYNFIPLNEKIVSIYSNKDEVPTFDKFHKDLFTGYIDINIEAKTPIYIRDTAENNAKDNKENSDFFSPAGRNRIPGSSIRGLIRNIVEIASYSKLNFIDGNRKFHFRSFMDKSLNLKDAYVDYMLKSNNNVIEYPKLKAGYIVKKGHNKYIIIPSFSKKNNCWFYRVEQKIVNGVIDNNINIKQSFYKIFFKPVESTINTHHDVKIKYAKVTQISKNNDNGFIEGYVIRSGYVSGEHKDKTPAGKHLDWIIAKPQDNAKEIPVARNVIENYKNDINRSADSIDLLKSLNGKSKEVPCFYVTDNNNNENIISIGHTGMFRLAYKHELNYFVKQKYESNTIDIAMAIFGNESDFASRVFFEDAYLNDNSKDKIQNNPVTPKILSEPKPTSFQLYLNQYKENIRTKSIKGDMEGLRDYNSADAEIRGYKLYWHKNINAQEYVETDSIALNKHSSQYTKIKPIKTGAEFSGRIRFENLSEVELGALLFSLKLKENLCHKIGMGKPLGLGSIKITPSLTVFNIEKRYSELFDGWDTEPSKENISIDDYINSFDKYIREKIDAKDKKSLWDVDRIKELEIMSDFENKPRNDETEYMAIKEDKNKKRGILPKPSELIFKGEKIQ